MDPFGKSCESLRFDNEIDVRKVSLKAVVAAMQHRAFDSLVRKEGEKPADEGSGAYGGYRCVRQNDLPAKLFFQPAADFDDTIQPNGQPD